MTQEVIVILIVIACTAWLAVQAYRFFRPKPNGKICGGNCCDHSAPPPPKAASSGERVMMISSDDLRARLKARRG